MDKIDDSQASTMNRIGWGTGAGTAAATDTTLFSEDNDGRATATLSQQTVTVAGDTYQAVGTITSTTTKTITNAGLFDAATEGTGNMLIKGDHAGIPVLANDSVEYTFRLQVSAC